MKQHRNPSMKWLMVAVGASLLLSLSLFSAMAWQDAPEFVIVSDKTTVLVGEPISFNIKITPTNPLENAEILVTWPPDAELIPNDNLAAPSGENASQQNIPSLTEFQEITFSLRTLSPGQLQITVTLKAENLEPQEKISLISIEDTGIETQETPEPEEEPVATAEPEPEVTDTATPVPTAIDTATPVPMEVPTAIPSPTSTPITDAGGVEEPSPEPTATSDPETPDESAGDESFLSSVAMIAGSVAGVVILAAAAWLFLRKRKRPGPTQEPPDAGITQVLPPEGPSGAGISPSPDPEPIAILNSINPPGQAFGITETITTIGRAADRKIRITEVYPHWETVSRKHAEIRVEGDRCVIYDLDSDNGVYVNGRRTKANVLRDGWRVGIGGVEFIFQQDLAQGQ